MLTKVVFSETVQGVSGSMFFNCGPTFAFNSTCRECFFSSYLVPLSKNTYVCQMKPASFLSFVVDMAGNCWGWRHLRARFVASQLFPSHS
jgi:hypothetical protein